MLFENVTSAEVVDTAAAALGAHGAICGAVRPPVP